MLTVRHWHSKELFATTYWTLIGPGFWRVRYTSDRRQRKASFPRTPFDQRRQTTEVQFGENHQGQRETARNNTPGLQTQRGLLIIQNSSSKSKWAHIRNAQDFPFVLKAKLRKSLALGRAESEGGRPA